MFKKHYLGIFLLLLALCGCDKLEGSNKNIVDEHNNQQDDVEINNSVLEDLESKINVTSNPCLDPTLIDSIKSSIIKDTEEMISLKYNTKELNPELLNRINNTNIVFNHISEPNLNNKGVDCTATIETTYIGDENTKDDILRDFVGTLNLKISDLLTPNFGINKLNISDFNFKDIDNNTFGYEVEYLTQSSYSENGELQTIYKATTTPISKMLATLIIIDTFSQQVNKELDKKKKLEKEKANDKNKQDPASVKWIKEPRIVFPEAAKRHAKPGKYTTTLKLTVGKDGKIKGIDVVSSSGIDVLDREAQKQVRSGRLKPFTQNGVPIESQVTVPIQYVLTGDDTENTKENPDDDYQSSKLHLNNAYTLLEDKGLVTDELIEQQKEWLRKRNSQCGNDNVCKYKLNMARADEFLEMAKD